MIRKIQWIAGALLLFTAMPLTAQVLWSDDFDNHNIGLLSNDPSGQTAGQGGWYCTFGANNSVEVISEIGRGNVIATGKSSNGGGIRLTQKKIDALWNTRTAGNNVLMFEFDFYNENILPLIPPNTFYTPVINIRNGTKTLVSYSFRVNTNYFVGEELILLVRKSNAAGDVDDVDIPYYYSWTKYELFIDYNTNSVIFYIPSQNYKIEFNIINEIPDGIEFILTNTYSSTKFVTKLDNFKLSAIPILPSYLNVSKFVSEKFAVFPNPVTDVVTITNSENIGIESIEIFDVSGKMVKSQNCKNENEVQLHMSDFAVGMYLLHIQTNEGVAVKKVVKM